MKIRIIADDHEQREKLGLNRIEGIELEGTLPTSKEVSAVDLLIAVLDFSKEQHQSRMEQLSGLLKKKEIIVIINKIMIMIKL